MSAVLIRAALETALAAMSPALLTAWENDAFTPPGASTPWQEVALLLAQPENAETGGQYTQRGFLQVSLRYPTGVGTGAASTRAEAVRAAFKKGFAFSSGGVTVRIFRTPEVLPGRRDGDRWLIPVRVYFTAQINT